MIVFFTRYVLGYRVERCAPSIPSNKSDRFWRVSFFDNVLAVKERWKSAVKLCEELSGLQYRPKKKVKCNVKRTEPKRSNESESSDRRADPGGATTGNG